MLAFSDSPAHNHTPQIDSARRCASQFSLALSFYMIKPSTSISEIVSGFFDSFDNRKNRVPDFSLFTMYFVDGSVIANRSNTGVEIWSLHEFWKPRIELLTGGRLTEFHEWETESETSIFNGIAIRCSTYQKAGLLDGLPYDGIGTKCFQFALTPDGWRITYVLWEDQE
jgi:hypothetical protein